MGVAVWWLLFPPIAEALFSGNPQLVVLALLVTNNPIAAAVATGLKVYAFIPLLGETRWRQIGITVLFNVSTIPIAPNHRDVLLIEVSCSPTFGSSARSRADSRSSRCRVCRRSTSRCCSRSPSWRSSCSLSAIGARLAG